MRWSQVVWLSLVGACATPTTPPDFGASRFTVDTTPDALTVTLLPDPAAPTADPGLSLRFPATGIRLPDSLKFPSNGDELVQKTACPFEGGIGTTLYPILQASGGDTPPGDLSSHADVEINGRAIVRVKVDYDVPYTCSGVHTMHGESSFTIMPHGRIVRHDTVTANTAALTDPTQGCGCGPGDSGYFFNSAWTFPGDTAVMVDDTDQATTAPARDGVCATYPATGVGVGVQWAAAERPPSGGLRLVTDGPRASVIYDFLSGAGAPVVPAMSTGDVTSFVQLSPGAAACSAILDQVREAPHTLTVNGMEAHLDGSGFYLEPTTFDSTIVLATSNGIPAGFVVALDLRGRHHARLSASFSTDDGWFIPDRDPSTDRALFWFRDALAAGQTITIEPVDD